MWSPVSVQPQRTLVADFKLPGYSQISIKTFKTEPPKVTELSPGPKGRSNDSTRKCLQLGSPVPNFCNLTPEGGRPPCWACELSPWRGWRGWLEGWTMTGWAGSRVGSRNIMCLYSAKPFPEAVMNFRSGCRTYVRFRVGNNRAGHPLRPSSRNLSR